MKSNTAKGRLRMGKSDGGRDAGGFVALPWSVLDCAAYAGLSVHARALLLEVARQIHKDNNGRLLLTRKYLATRGWHSAGTIQKAKDELLASGFIFETVKGRRPHSASWYAVTWRSLDRLPGYDLGAMETFQRSAYRLTPGQAKRAIPSCLTASKSPSPHHGTEGTTIAPPHGTAVTPSVPPDGAIKAVFDPSSVPPHGIHLDMPSSESGFRLPPCSTHMGLLLRCVRPRNRSNPYHLARAKFSNFITT